MKMILAPQKLPRKSHPVIFLAGSIEMGQAEDWQSLIAKRLENYSGTLLNPRREHWGYDWKQSIKDKRFKEQLEWELSGLRNSNYIVMYFAPDSKSPISLLELGLFSRSHRLICCCPKKFWRHGNVEFICQKFKIPLVDDLDGLVDKLKRMRILKLKK